MKDVESSWYDIVVEIPSAAHHGETNCQWKTGNCHLHSGQF